MNESDLAKGLLENIRDARRNGGPDSVDILDLGVAFLAMGQTDDLWEHTGVPMETIREILVQAHNFIVIG